MEKEISGFLFSNAPHTYFGASFVFQLWVMLSKNECYNQYPMKNQALYLYPPSYLSQYAIPIKNKCYSYGSAGFYDTKQPMNAQVSRNASVIFRYVYYLFSICISHFTFLSISIFIHIAPILLLFCCANFPILFFSRKISLMRT